MTEYIKVSDIKWPEKKIPRDLMDSTTNLSKQLLKIIGYTLIIITPLIPSLVFKYHLEHKKPIQNENVWPYEEWRIDSELVDDKRSYRMWGEPYIEQPSKEELIQDLKDFAKSLGYELYISEDFLDE